MAAYDRLAPDLYRVRGDGDAHPVAALRDESLGSDKTTQRRMVGAAPTIAAATTTAVAAAAAAAATTTTAAAGAKVAATAANPSEPAKLLQPPISRRSGARARVPGPTTVVDLTSAPPAVDLTHSPVRVRAHEAAAQARLSSDDAVVQEDGFEVMTDRGVGRRASGGTGVEVGAKRRQVVVVAPVIDLGGADDENEGERRRRQRVAATIDMTAEWEDTRTLKYD